MSVEDTPDQQYQVISAKASRRAAKMLDYGNIIFMLLPLIPGALWLLSDNFLWLVLAIPPLILWFGVSMLVYAINRHHPNPQVGHHIQWAAYWYYGLVSPLVAVGIFIPKSSAGPIIGGGFLLVSATLIARSLIDIRRINRFEWEDTLVKGGQ